jgi:hypothetical protein
MIYLRCLILAIWDWLRKAPSMWEPPVTFRDYLSDRLADQRAIQAYEEYKRDPSGAIPYEDLRKELMD